MTRGNASLAVSLSSLSDEERASLLADLSDDEAEALLHDWAFWARPNQLAPPGDWLTWFILAGRGWGKTRTGAEWVRENTGTYARFALVGPTAADVRDVMVEGESGLLAIAPRWDRPEYQPSRRRVVWPNGCVAHTYSADEPDRLRGPQHEAAWADEVASWRYPEAWDQLQFGLRLGPKPRQVVTTTPKPVRIVRDLLAAKTTALVRGSTYENEANLAPSFFTQIVSRYEGTRLGRQELYAEVLDEVEGALWHRVWIDEPRVAEAPYLSRVVTAIDPATTHGPDSDQTGIVVAGRGGNGEFYVLHGYGYRLSPDGWARRAIALHDDFEGDRVIGERNNGGDMVEATIRAVRRDVPLKTIHASRGKTLRAEPIAALYEQRRVHHVGTHAELEDQMCLFPVATDLDDMVDALVYALTELSTSNPIKAAPTAVGVRPSPWRRP